MAEVPQVKIIEVVKALIFSAGMASSVVHADISSAASSLARQYGVASSQQIEADIARRLRNGG